MEGALTRLGEGWPASAKKRFDALDVSDQSALLHGIGELEEALDSKRGQYSLAQGARHFERVRQAVTVARETLSFILCRIDRTAAIHVIKQSRLTSNGSWSTQLRVER